MDGARTSDERDRDFYAEFYGKGGWTYNVDVEAAWLQTHLVGPLSLQQGLAVLDLGCGTGAQTEAWRRLGFRSVGVDRCAEGIAAARAAYPEGAFRQMDADDVRPALSGWHEAPPGFDLLFVRGMSWYHYALDGALLMKTQEVCRRVLKPGGLWVLVIKTDFSGGRTHDDVFHNKLSDYLRFGYRLGEVVHVADWNGRDLLRQGYEGAENIILAVQPFILEHHR